MAAESLYRRFGRLELPVEPSPANSIGDLASLDPARDIMLELFAAALTAELSPVWSAATVDTPLAECGPVAQKLPGLPTPELLGEMKLAFPFLSVSRSPTGAQFGDLTLETRSLTQRWDVDYILCPLAVTNLLRVQDILQAVGKVIDLVIENGGHRAYRTRQNGNASLLVNVLGSGSDCCGFWKCRVVDMALGPASFSAKGDGPRYYACGLTLETIELANFLTDAAGNPEDGESVPLEGATGTFGVTESGDPSIIARY
jgi:hypothetical protein